MKKETTIVSAGRGKEYTHGIVNPPVYRASTCIFDTYAEMQERNADPYQKHLYYGRKGTPTHWALSDALMALEGEKAAGCLLFPSGLAAMTSAILSQVKAGDHVLITDSAYDPTRYFSQTLLKDSGVEAEYYDPMIGGNIVDLLRENTACIIVEAPGSLTFEVQDVPAIVRAAKDHKATVIMDNTWATALNYQAFEYGVDVVVHAATKYIVGHSDVMIGAALANEACLPALRSYAMATGQTCSADDAYLALRGLRTMSVRLKQHEENALAVAQWLAAHPAVDRVLHPALPDCPGHEIWKRDFSGSTGLFSFVMKDGSLDHAAALVDDLHHYKMGFSWGGYESLILPTDPRSYRKKSKFQANGPTFRLHIGLEDPEDLITDLSAGIDRYLVAIKG
ncbi:cystathionine beta-lyase [Temperatibacter marinus]|uniref:Cystathionine beta-lyase n=2 Tax=Temperatibacter marinus TaxID=1456591 RepID=A0AA52HAG9_9PROT|nr:cystathionine beta-lyase [Temperatibacter marinus]WND02588.1 cystathionine beta-lyase [Temperatibacter marinus]